MTTGAVCFPSCAGAQPAGTGEEGAAALGVNVDRVRRAVFILARCWSARPCR
jgi:ABC-type Fe3+-siderophore transport system permease subunit